MVMTKRWKSVAILSLVLCPMILGANEARAAGKGKVKVIKDTTGLGIMFTGTLVDDKSGQDITFFQAFLDELGIGVGSEVQFETVVPAGQKAAVAVLLRPKNGPRAQKGKGIIKIILDKESGILVDRKTGEEIEFVQPFLEELRLDEGVEVDFCEVQEGKKGLNAVNVKKA
jgi:hypothetical protein